MEIDQTQKKKLRSRNNYVKCKQMSYPLSLLYSLSLQKVDDTVETSRNRLKIKTFVLDSVALLQYLA